MGITNICNENIFPNQAMIKPKAKVKHFYKSHFSQKSTLNNVQTPLFFCISCLASNS